MIETSNIKKMVNHILRRQRGVADREAMDPDREWLLGVGVTALLVVLGGLASYGLYLNTISLEVNAEHLSSVAIPYNAATVDTAVTAFRARAEAYTKIRGISGNETISIPVSLPEDGNFEETLPTDVASSTEGLPAVIDAPPPSEPVSSSTLQDGEAPALGV